MPSVLDKLRTDKARPEDVLEQALATIGGAKGLGDLIANIASGENGASDQIRINAMSILTKIMDAMNKREKEVAEYAMVEDQDIEAKIMELLGKAEQPVAEKPAKKPARRKKAAEA